jgi:uncharacterized protein (TIGR04255 family)
MKEMARPQEILGHGVARRFYVNADKAYPILQIGQGIYASNESSDYEFGAFKKQSLDGLRVVLDSYPKLEGYPLQPNYLELRYIDVFDETLLGTTNLVEFCNRATTLQISLPKTLTDMKLLDGQFSGRFLFQSKLKARKDTQIIFDVASGRQNETNKEIIRLETKIVSSALGVPKLKTPASFVTEVGKWLGFARGVTSPFFKDFIKPEIMKRFEDKN